MRRLLVAVVLSIADAQVTSKVILDSDTGLLGPGDYGHVDDASAVLMLLKSPQIELLGITQTSGNVWVDQGVQNALKLIELAGRSDVPVLRGAKFPLVHDVLRARDREKPAPGQWLGALGPWDPGPDRVLPPLGERPARAPLPQPAAAFLVEQARLHPGAVTILAIGPLTNLALAMRLDEDFDARLEKIVIMGGSFGKGPGAAPAAEFNFWWDAEAAEIVLRSRAKVVLIPLDACNKTKYRHWQFDAIAASGNRVSRFYRRADAAHWKTKPEYSRPLYDAVAAAYLLEPKIFTDVRRARVEIETDRLSYGASRLRPEGAAREIDVAFGLDPKGFDTLFASLLSAPDRAAKP